MALADIFAIVQGSGLKNLGATSLG